MVSQWRLFGNRLPAFLTALAILAGCHAKPTSREMGLGPPDNPKSYFGPVIRSRADVPDYIMTPLCTGVQTAPCFANPDEEWESGDAIRDIREPRQQIIWLRRLGQNYVMYRRIGGYNSSVEFVVLSRNGSKYAVTWSAEFMEYDAKLRNIRSTQPSPPISLDPKITSLVKHVFTDKNPCDPGNGMAFNRPDCTTVNRWPYQ